MFKGNIKVIKVQVEGFVGSKNVALFVLMYSQDSVQACLLYLLC